MALISLGKIDKNLIPILFACIFCFCNRLINQYDGTLLFNNPILTSIYGSLSFILAVIPYFIFKIRTKLFDKINIKIINNSSNTILFINKRKKKLLNIKVYLFF